MKKRLTALITVLALAITCFAVPASAASNNYMYRGSDKNRTVYVGQEFELYVIKGSGLSENSIKWTSSNTSVVKYDDDDRYDDEMEFQAVKSGSATITAENLKTGGKYYFYVTVKSGSGDIYIYRGSDKNRSVYAGQEFELYVKKGSGLSENSIKWTSSNTGVVKYDDDDRYDNEMEFQAVKSGSATITAENLKTGGKIYFYVTVKSSSGDIYINQVGNSTKYMGTYDDYDISVKKGSGLYNSNIKWSIGDSSLLKFEDGDNYGSEVELVSNGKSGSTKVTATNLKTGGKIVYTVKVSPEYDD